MLKRVTKREPRRSRQFSKNNIFTQHPHEMDHTYFEHLYHAFFNGFFLILCGIACLIHSLFPFLFTYTASTNIKKISKRMNFKINNIRSNIVDQETEK